MARQSISNWFCCTTPSEIMVPSPVSNMPAVGCAL